MRRYNTSVYTTYSPELIGRAYMPPRPYVPWYFQIARVLCVIAFVSASATVAIGAAMLLIYINEMLAPFGFMISISAGVLILFPCLDIFHADLWYKTRPPSTPGSADPE